MANDGVVEILLKLNTIVDSQDLSKSTKSMSNLLRSAFKQLSVDLHKQIDTTNPFKHLQQEYLQFLTQLKNNGYIGDEFSLLKQLSEFRIPNFSDEYATLAKLGQELIKQSKEYKTLTAEMESASRESEILTKQVQEQDFALSRALNLKNTRKDWQNLVPEDTQKRLAEYEAKMADLTNRFNQAKEARDNLDISQITSTSKKALTEFVTEYAKLKENQEKANSETEEFFKNIGSKIEVLKSKTTDSYEDIYTQIDKIGTKYTSIFNKITNMGKQKTVAPFAFKDLENEINNVREQAGELGQEIVKLIDSKKAFAVGNDASSKAQEQEYNRISQVMKEMEERYNALVEHLEEVKNKAQEIGETASKSSQNISKEGENILLGMSSQVRKVSYTLRAFSYLGKTITKPFQDIIDYVRSIVSVSKRAVSAISSFVSKTVNAIKSVVRKAFSLVKSLVTGIVGKVKEMSSHFHGINFSFGDLFKTARSLFKKIFSIFTRFGLGFRSLFALVRRLRSTFIEMYKAAAEQIPEINAQVSYLMTLINQLKGSLVTMFQPLISSFFPDTNNALDDLTKKVVDLANTVGSFMAGLTGQGFIYKFVADEQDYAASVAEAADKTKDATKATKEYKRELMGFDQINRLSAPDEDKTDSESAYDPTANAKGHWEKIPITDKNAKELAKKIKELWEKVKEAWKEGGDFTNIGKKISEWIAKFFDKAIDFIENKLKDFGIKLTTALATFLNGLLTKDLANKIGEFAGKLINTIQAIIRNFFAKFNWHKLGEFLAASLNRAIKTWNAKEFGKMIADFFIAAISTAWSFVKDFDFEQLGKKLSDAINNFFSRMSEVDPYTGLNHWQELGQTISNAIKGVYHTITETVKNIDWKQVVTSIITVFKNIDWKGIADAMKGLKDAVWDAIKIIFNSIKDAVPSDWADKLKEKIKQGAEKLKNIGEILLVIIVAKIEETDWTAIGTKIANMINGTEESTLINDLKVLASTVWNAIKQVLLAPDDNGNTLAYDLGTKLVEFLTKAADTIYDLLANGGDGETIVGQIWAGIRDAFNAWKEENPDAWDFAKKLAIIFGVSKGISFIGDLALSVVGLATAFKGLGDVFKWIADTKVFTILKDGLSNLASWFSSGVGLIVANFAAMAAAIALAVAAIVVNFDSFKQLGKQFIEGIQIFASNTVAKVKEWLTDFTYPFVAVYNVVKDFCTRFGETLKAIVDHIFHHKDQTTTLSEDIEKIWTGFWDTMKKNAAEGGKALVNSFIDVINGLIDIFSSWLKVLDAFLYGMTGLIGDALSFWGDKLDSSTLKNAGGKMQGWQANWQSMQVPHIPKLAQGAVIPPNKEFLAMLGDQSHGTNIEAPLSTIQQAVADVMDDNLDAIAVMIEAVVNAINSKDMSVNIGDKEIGQAAARYTRKQNLVKGTA